MRYGPLRNTVQGKLEDRSPFVHLVFPEWFQEKYSTAISVLKSNVNRLTTPHDIYETLEDLLNLTGEEIISHILLTCF